MTVTITLRPEIFIKKDSNKISSSKRRLLNELTPTTSNSPLILTTWLNFSFSFLVLVMDKKYNMPWRNKIWYFRVNHYINEIKIIKWVLIHNKKYWIYIYYRIMCYIGSIQGYCKVWKETHVNAHRSEIWHDK